MNHPQGVERAIEALAVEQLGVFSRGQALALGATRRMIEGRRQSGSWPLVLPAIHRLAVVVATPAQSAMAACLWSAPGGLVSHETAAELWGFEGIVSDGVHLTLPMRRNLRSGDIRVHRTRDLLPADIAHKGPIALTSPLRAAIDLAGAVDADTLEIAIESALRRRMFSPGQLRWRSEALMGTGRPGSAQLRKLLDSRELGRSDSGWEVRTAQLLEGAGLGAPTRQHQVRHNGRVVARVDLAYPEARLIIEYDSDAWHSGVKRRHHDIDRRNQLRALGWTVLEVTRAQLRHPTRFVEQVRTLLAA